MWKKYVDQVISELNQIQTLPNSGILSGGAIANKLWEKVSGNKAVVNDIDIFVLKSIKPLEENYDVQQYGDFKHFSKSVDASHGVHGEHNGYQLHLIYGTTTKTYYKILDTQRQGMLNYVDVEANVFDPNVIIKSFDINCVQVAYDLSDGKLYYTPEFEEFMRTGYIQITNINTPSHTLLRILSKRDAMNAKLDMVREISYIKRVHTHIITRNIRMYFSDKYLSTYKRYERELKSLGFYLETNNHTHYYGNKNLPDKIYALRVESVDDGDMRLESFDYIRKASMYMEPRDKNIRNLYSLNFYYKYIYGNAIREAIFPKIGHFWLMGEEYFEGYSDADLERMGDTFSSIEKWTDKFPIMKKSLYGLTLKKQLSTLKYLKAYLMTYKEKTELLNIINHQMDFESENDVRDFFLIMQIKYRKKMAKYRTFERHRQQYQR
jgi:hypothetical protein